MDWVIEGNGLGGTQEVRKIEPCEQLSRAFTGPPKVPLEAGSQNQAFSGFLSVPFLAKTVQIAPGLRQFFENLSGLWK